MEEIKPGLCAANPALLKRWNTYRNNAGAWTMVDVMWVMREFDAAGKEVR